MQCPKCTNDEKFYLYRWHLMKHKMVKVQEEDATIHYETVDEQHISLGNTKQIRCGVPECDYEGKPEEFGFTE